MTVVILSVSGTPMAGSQSPLTRVRISLLTPPPQSSLTAARVVAYGTA